MLTRLLETEQPRISLSHSMCQGTHSAQCPEYKTPVTTPERI